MCSFYVLYYFPGDGAGCELLALNVIPTQFGCHSYHLLLKRNSALIQKSSAQTLKGLNQHGIAENTKNCLGLDTYNAIK